MNKSQIRKETPSSGKVRLTLSAPPDGGFPHGVSTLSYHPTPLPGGHPAVAPTRDRSGGNADHLRFDRVVHQWADPLGPSSDADTRESVLAGSLPRRHQPIAAGDAALESRPYGIPDLLGKAAGSARLPLLGRRGHREGFRQALGVGGVDLLFCQEAQGSWATRGGPSVVQRRW